MTTLLFVCKFEINLFCLDTNQNLTNMLQHFKNFIIRMMNIRIFIKDVTNKNILPLIIDCDSSAIGYKNVGFLKLWFL